VARSRRGPRTRLDPGERRALGALKRAQVYKPKGTPSPRSLHRKLRQPGMAELAAGRAKAVKVGTKSARAFKTLPHARDRVIVAEPPNRKIYARQGEVYEVEIDLQGRVVPSGAKRRIAKEPFVEGQRPPPITGRGRGARGYVITVNGYPSAIFFPSLEQAQAYARRFYQRPQRAARFDPDALIVSIDPIRRSEFDELLELAEQRQQARREAKRERMRNLRAARRAIRPFR
jgi:hypothetical protein